MLNTWFEPVNLIDAYVFCSVLELLDFKAELMEQVCNTVLIDVGSREIIDHRYDDSVATWRAVHRVNILHTNRTFTTP